MAWFVLVFVLVNQKVEGRGTLGEWGRRIMPRGVWFGGALIGFLPSVSLVISLPFSSPSSFIRCRWLCFPRPKRHWIFHGYVPAYGCHNKNAFRNPPWILKNPFIHWKKESWRILEHSRESWWTVESPKESFKKFGKIPQSTQNTLTC